MGVINQNLLLIDFSLEIYIQLEQKCQSELVEDIKKDTFRYFLHQYRPAQCENLVKISHKNYYTLRDNTSLFTLVFYTFD